MSITLKELLDLKSTKDFTQVAGGTGLAKQVDMVDMLDFGLEHQTESSVSDYGDDKTFEEGSFVISSLLFAKNDSEKLYKTVVQLIKCGVVGMAYKTIFYQDLPKNVIRLADSSDFAIFRIDSNVTYREIIVESSSAIKLNKDIEDVAGCLSQLQLKKLDIEEVATLAAKISHQFRGNAKVVLIIPASKEDQFSVNRVIRNFQLYKEYKTKVIICGYFVSELPGIALIATMNEKNIKKFDVLIENALSDSGIDLSRVLVGYSNIHHTFTSLNACVIEASESLIACRVLDKKKMQFNEIGTLSFLIPSADNPFIRTFMQTYLGPILDDEESMRTAIAIVQAGGNVTAAAEKLHLHKNTIRYRLKRIQELTSTNMSYNEFYERLATAIKVYLICRFRILGEIN